MIPRFLIVWALVAAILLPIGVAVLYGVGTLLGALGDASGAWAIGRIALACGILWGVDLIGLVLILAIGAATDAAPQRRQPPGEAMPSEGAHDEE